MRYLNVYRENNKVNQCTHTQICITYRKMRLINMYKDERRRLIEVLRE